MKLSHGLRLAATAAVAFIGGAAVGSFVALIATLANIT
jgi:hypothetical protein